MELSKDEKEVLIRFNETANKIFQSKFYQEAKEKTIQMTVHHHWTKDRKPKGSTIEVDFHNPDFIELFLIPLRQFFMVKEGISFRNLSDLYHKADFPKELIKKFDEARNSFNNFLDSNSMTVFEEKYSNREVFETIVNGDYFHNDPKKRELLEKWKNNPIKWSVCWVVFQQILYKSIEAVELISKLNEEILKDFSSKT